MRSPHPSWPNPLLALEPIRLRPMGWLDELLPLRPPSLWTGKSLYARTLRWQPDTADLSWLFDAYAMLGIELPPPRIEHRTHQRMQRRGSNRRGKDLLRRQRAPIKGGQRPLVVPQWSKTPAMRGPGPSPATRIDINSSKTSTIGRTGFIPNVPSFQWRSSTVERGVGNRIAPALIDKPTLLQGPTVQEDVPRNVRSDVGPTRPSEPETSNTQRQSRTLNPLLKSQTRVSTDSVQDGSDSIRSQNRVPIQPTAEVSKTLLRRDVSAAPTPLLDSRKIEDFQGRSSTVNVRASSVLPHQKAEAQFLDSAQSSEETSQATSMVRRIPASRLPPKVTWKPTHRQSPWRLHPTNQTDRVQQLSSTNVVYNNDAGIQRGDRKAREGERALNRRWRLSSSFTTRPYAQRNVDSTKQILDSTSKLGSIQVESSSFNVVRSDAKFFHDGSGKRWRLRRDQAVSPEAMIWQPMAIVQRQLLDVPSSESSSYREQSNDKLQTFTQRKTVSMGTVQSQKKGASESTSRTVEVSPLVKAQQVNKVPSNDIQQAELTTGQPPIINWRPSIQPVRWRLLRTGQKMVALNNHTSVRIVPPHPTRERTQSLVPESLDTSKQALFEKAREQTKNPSTIQSKLITSDSVQFYSTEFEKSESSETVVRAESVRIPNRVPWRLRTTSTNVSRTISQGGLVDNSVERTVVASKHDDLLLAPSERSSLEVMRINVPRIAFWHPPSRKELIQHFRSLRLQDDVINSSPTPTMNDVENIPTTKPLPSYSFTYGSQGSLFRPQEQSLMMPLQAGTMVFPTPDLVPDVGVENRAGRSDNRIVQSRLHPQPISTPKKQNSTAAKSDSNAVEFGTNSADLPSRISKNQREKQYPSAYVQQQSSYQRRSVFSTVPIIERALRRSEAGRTGPNKRSTLSGVELHLTQLRWRLSNSAQTGTKFTKTGTLPPSAATTWTPRKMTQVQLLIPTDLESKERKFVRGQLVSSKQTKVDSEDTLIGDISWQGKSLALPKSNPIPKTILQTIEPDVLDDNVPSSDKILQVSWHRPPRFANPFQPRTSSYLNDGYTQQGRSKTQQVQAINLTPSLVYQPVMDVDVQANSPKTPSTPREDADAFVEMVSQQGIKLSKSDQGLLRAQIALPTQWLSQGRGQVGQSVQSMINSAGVQQTMLTVTGIERDGNLPSNQEARSQTLTTGQINRIVESQVAFFRAAQRQSFLKSSQMGGGTIGRPSAVRDGVQSVAQEMRQALQRMVLSASQEHLLLDAVERGLQQEVSRQGETFASAKPNGQRKSNALSGLTKGRYRPSWRPKVHATGRTQNVVFPTQTGVYLDESMSQQTTESVDSSTELVSVDTSKKRSGSNRPRSGGMVQPMSMMRQSDLGVFVRPKKETVIEESPVHSESQDPLKVDSQSEVIMIDPSGKLLTGEAATKRLTEMGFARSESVKKTQSSVTSSGTYTWEAPPDVMDDMMQQVRKQFASEQQEVTVREGRNRERPRQSVIQELTEEQLLSILVELSSDSPEANALLREVQERVEEYFDLDRFRRI